MKINFLETYLEVKTTIILQVGINVIRNTMRKNFVAVSTFAGIIHSVNPSIKLGLKEWDENPMKYKAGF